LEEGDYDIEYKESDVMGGGDLFAGREFSDLLQFRYLGSRVNSGARRDAARGRKKD
jgi:hypothetical protein